VVVEATVLDLEAVPEYRRLAEHSIAQYGGRYLLQASEPAAVEGRWEPGRRLTVLEFPDAQRVEQWYGSAEYARAKSVREGAIEMRLLVAESPATS
jgi:uncharacterized protein (DUF1330 family)